MLGGCSETVPVRAEVSAEADAGAEASGTNAEADAEQGAVPGDSSWPSPSGEIPSAQEAAAAGKLFEWRADSRDIDRIVIDTDTQQARMFADNELVGWSTVATGVATHRTPTGDFAVMEKVEDKRSNLYGRIYNSQGQLVKRNARQGRDAIPAGGRFVGARMPHFMRMTYDGVGMHAGRIPRPGHPASHGCIRMPAAVADELFDRVDANTRVTVIGSKGPSYGNYAERIQQRQAESQALQAAARAREQGTAIDALDAEIAALRGEDLPLPTASESRPARDAAVQEP
ncbi:hypothetical protein CKO36_12875 [Rhabdochromatium marinum]|nr:hypothetical protein [Rhabdochromatium marinum]